MRVDFQQGDHLRVGRLIIARARQAVGGPIVDGGGTGLVRIDEGAALEVIARASLLADMLDSDGIDPDEVGAQASRLRTAITEHEWQRTAEQFGVLVFRLPGGRAVAVGWKDARAPHPHRWRPRFLAAQARWVLAGRPGNVYVADTGELRPRSALIGGESAVEFVERSALAGDFVRRDGSHGDRYDEVTPLGDGGEVR